MRQVERILVVRLSALGDCIHVMPAVHALRKALPHAFIAWAVEDRARALVENHPDIDQAVVIPRGEWKRRGLSLFGQWRASRPIARRLRDMRFDAAIDFQGLTKSGLVLWASRARRRIGYGDRDARELSRLFTNERITPPPSARHVIDRNNALLSALGITHVEPHFAFHTPNQDARAVDGFLESHGLARAPFAVINPAGSWETKYWPAERYGQVAAALLGRASLRSVVTWHGPKEKAEAHATAATSAGAAILAPPTTLGALAHLLKRAALYIGLETGPTHMAAGLGVPAVCLAGPSDPQRNGPYGPGHEIVELGPRRLSCARCWLRRGCPHGLRCMLEITPQMVTAAAARALSRSEVWKADKSAFDDGQEFGAGNPRAPCYPSLKPARGRRGSS